MPLVFALPGQSRFVARAGGVELERIEVRRFRDGELHVEVPACAAGRRCVVVGSIAAPPGNLERVTLVAHALCRAGASRVTALLPYLAYARQDHAAPSQSLGLAWVGGLLRASGIDEVTCVDVHSHAAAGVLGLPLTSLSPAAILAAALPPAWREDVAFVAPDEGAIDRCTAVARAAGSPGPVAWLRKRRTATTVEHTAIIGAPGRRAIVVDDILDTGGTLLSCCRELRRTGVEQIGVVATHALFTGQDWRAMFDEGVRALWITDTILSPRRPHEAHIVPVAPLLMPTLTPFAGP
ncbi:MAG: ribose-phosphate diphosphokinase [Solirubrobacteraceae bacterium]